MNNLQDFLNNAVRQQRQQALKDSPQMVLGELIKAIEDVGLLKNDGTPKLICFDFGYMRPTDLDSWRGSYCELALGYTEEGAWDAVKADVFLQSLKDAIGKTYQGYKGGDFEMSETTPIWVDNYGMASSTAIVGVKDEGYKIVLLTAHCEY